MAITLSTGVTISIASTYSSTAPITALSNASPAVATVDNDPQVFTIGDYVEVSSGWDLLDKRVCRVSAQNATTITLENVDTSNTTSYPVATGTGTVRKITAFTQMTQVKSISSSGGTQNFADITSLADRTERKVPTTRAAIDMTLDVYDDPTLSWYAAVETADEARTPYGLLMSFPNGSKLAGNAYWSLMRVPTITQNEALMTQVTLSYAAEPVRYST